MAFEIEKGVPLPKSVQRGWTGKYPWRQLEIGDSFFVPGKTTNDIGGTVTIARRTTGFKLVTRSVEGGVRIWRVA